MKTAPALHVGFGTHPGLQRGTNEDRLLIDEVRGIYLVIDGLGGHAAGEAAAETAAETIRNFLTRSDPPVSEEQIRKAVTEANNRIFEYAQSRAGCSGMACVLTLAAVGNEQLTVGHVGDSRLYLVSDGSLRKVTSDHSPVGEWQERGELTENQAMQHPRRHEVFRDVGSERRQPNDEGFIETKRIPFSPAGAFLLCTDGLTDSLTEGEINRIIQNYRGNGNEVAQALIEAANRAGGKDNVSVIFAAGPDFRANAQPISDIAADRHSITQVRVRRSRWALTLPRLSWLLIGIVLGAGGWSLSERWMSPEKRTPSAVGGRSPAHLAANPLDARSIIHVLAGASPGDIIDVPPGDYLGPIALKEGVSIIGSGDRRAVVRSDGAASANLGIAFSASGIHGVRIENLQITGDETHPLRIGIAVRNSTIRMINSKITGAVETGIRVEGQSEAEIIANDLSGNSGAGLTAENGSFVRLIGNWITDNGQIPGHPQAGLAMDPAAKLEAFHNVLERNGLSEMNSLPQGAAAQLRQNNFLSERGSKMKVSPLVSN